MYLGLKAGQEEERGRRCRWTGKSGGQCLPKDYPPDSASPGDPTKVWK